MTGALRTRTPGPAITVVVVTRGVSAYLDDTLRALAAQTRIPDRVVVVDAAAEPADDVAQAARQTLAPLATDLSVAVVPGAATFGAAVLGALGDLENPIDVASEWLWLLHDDSAPEPGALEAMVRAVEHAPSVAVAGVKQRGWADRRLLEVGVTTSRFGRRMTGIDEGEVDQGQHDGREDVLGVGLAGALVRRDVWDALGGTDPELGPFGDGLDLSRRARLAGHRVVVVPSAVVRHAQASYRGLRDGTADPRRSFRARRRAQVHARLVGAPAVLLPFVVIGVVIAGVARALARLATHQAALAVAEIAAPVAALGHPGRLVRLRRRARLVEQVSRRSLRPLEATWREVLREQRDAHRSRVELSRGGGAPSELELSEIAALTGRRRLALGVLVAGLVAVSVLVLGELTVRLVGGGSLVGGALLPARAGLGELVRAATSGWVAGDLGAPGPADPLLAVLVPVAAVVGVAGAVDLFFLGALVLAGLGAWFAAGAATRSVGVRAWAALVWVAAPGLALGLDGGRLGAVVAHVALPWVALGVARAIGVQRQDVVLSGLVGARRVGEPDAEPDDATIEPVSLVGPPTGSFTAAGAAGLAFAVVVAGAPVLLPFGVLALMGVAAAAPRRRGRLVLVVLPALALFGPMLVGLLGSGGWRLLLADPGLPLASRAAPAWQQLLAWPVAPQAWAQGPVAAALPFVLGGVVGVLALLALLRGAAVSRGVRAGWLVAVCGLTAAIVSGRVETAAGQSVVVRGWPGPGVSLLLLGLLGAAVLGAGGLRARMARFSFGWRQAGVAVLTVLAVLAPLAGLAEWTVRSRGAADPAQVSVQSGVVVPAVGQQAQTSPDRSRILALGIDATGALSYQFLGADGPQLTDAAAAVDARSVAGGPGAARVVRPDAAARQAARVVARLGVATPDGPVVRLALHDGRQEAVAHAGVVGVVPLVDTREQPVLEVGHDPGAAARSGAPPVVVPEVDGLHVAVSVVQTVRLGVAVVIAATAVVVSTVEDRVHALRLVAGGDAVGAVVAVAGAGGRVDAVGLVAIDHDRRRSGVGQVVRAASRPAAGRLGQVVPPTGLVVDDGDDAGRTGAEGVLCGGGGVTAGG